MTTSSGTNLLPEQIASQLSDRVIRGVYPPGYRLVEATLSKEFRVSHGPIRDALRTLHASGLVTIHPYRGAHVTHLSAREVRDLYLVRASLVGIRAKWIAEDPDRQLILQQVKGPIERLMVLAIDPTKAEAFVTEMFALNGLLTDSLSNRWLRSTLQAISLQTNRYSRLALLRDTQRRQEAAQMWRTLYEAMSSGDPDLAEKIAYTLSLTARDAAIKSLEHQGANSKERKIESPKQQRKAMPASLEE